MRLQRRCSDPDVTADVLQDTFVAVWHAAAGYRGEGDVGAWVWGIAVRRLVSRVRVRQQPRPVGEEVLAAASPAVRSAEDELLVAAEYGDVGMALRAISPELRAVVQATVLDGLTTKEAGLQGIAVGLVAGLVGVAAILAVMAWSTWQRHRAVATPARSISTVVVAAAAFVALSRPLGNGLPLFPHAAGVEVWQRSAWCWAALAVASAAGLVVVLAFGGITRGYGGTDSPCCAAARRPTVGT